MMMRVVAAALVVSGAAFAQAAPVEGNWLGKISAGPTTLRLALKVAKSAGAYTATMDSIDQGARDLKIDRIAFQDGELQFEMTRLRASYSGKMSADGKRISGTWKQGTQELPLEFEAVPEVPAIRRPQEPRPPFPYREEEVSYENPMAGVQLGATLTIPAGEGPFPAVMLLTGSGPQNRDEELFGHKPFRVIADQIARAGVAVLRADDRGVGKSTGRPNEATLEDLAGDALTAVAFLRQRKEIDSTRIGVLGHSEGAAVAPLAAVRSKDIRFLVLLAPPAVPGDQVMLKQAEAIGKASGAPKYALDNNARLQEALFGIVRTEADPAARRAKLDAYAGSLPTAVQQVVQAQIPMVTAPWFRYFLMHDPAVALASVRVPVLAMWGELDLQVLPSQNEKPLKAALDKAGVKYSTVRLPGLNHLFQTAKSGVPNEYGQIEETFAPAALQMISKWVSEQTAK
jgi:hypothetical protein